jgi:histidinol-phosphate aminotransferase
MHQAPPAPLSRRRFAQLFGLGVATAALGPAAARAAAAAAGQAAAGSPAGAAGGAPAGAAGGAAKPPLRLVRAALDPEAVRLSSNENPYGPARSAFDAMREAFGVAWRYPDEQGDALADDLARHNAVAASSILLGAGSSEILKLCAAAFAGPGRPAVVAEPTFEALGHHVERTGGDVRRVPLTVDFRHDTAKLLAAAPDGGLIYVCNPNNPTATITPKAELRALLAAVPARTTVLVDEAYHHYVESADYETVIPLVAQHPNLVVARTFSKIYGLAGLRCGYAVAQPETIARLRAHQQFDSVNVMALVAARAGLADAEHTASGRRLNAEVKSMVVGELDRLGYRTLPSEANFLMIDLRRPVGPVREALHARRVDVGRVFPPLPNHLRVTVGTRPQMQAFLAAFRQAIA